MMKRGIIFMALLSLLFIHSAFSQWIQTDGPYGDIKISSLFVYNGNVYAGTSCGLHSTSGATGRWDLRASFNVEAFLLKGNVLYFGGPNLGLRIMNMDDQTFKPTSGGLDGVTILTIAEADTCLYASVKNQGFYKSKGYTNQGNFINRGLPNVQGGTTYHVTSIETMGNNLFVGTHRGVYRSDATRMAWSPLTNGLPTDSVQVIKEIDNILYAGIGNSLYSSTDNGDSWSQLHVTGSMISSIHKVENTLYVGTYGSGVYRDKNNWEPIPGSEGINITTMTSIGTTLICGTMSNGIYVYDGTNWLDNSKGIICSTIMSMVNTGKSIVANDPGNVFTLSATAYSWANISPPVSKWYFGSVASMDETIFLSYKDNNSQSVIKYKMPGSTTWNDLADPMPNTGEDASHLGILGKTLYVYIDDHLDYTSNQGASWADQNINSPYCSEIADFEIFKGTPYAVACGNGELLKLSANNTWELSNTGLPPDRKVTSMAFSSDAIYAHVEGNGIFVSKDEGHTWTLANQGFYTGSGIHSHAYYNQNIFISSAKSVYYSSDYGQQWTSIGQGLPNKIIGPMVIYNDTLFVGTHGNGIWKREIASLITILPDLPDSTRAPKRISIYPNPAKEFVYFDFADSQTATIQLVDIMGRVLLTTKLDEHKRIPVDRYASGTYIIVITTDRYVYNSVLIKRR